MSDRFHISRRNALGLASGAAGLLIGGRALAQPPMGPPPGGFGPGGPGGGPMGPPPPGKPYVFESAEGPNGRCILIPEETAGPYPVDLNADPHVHRIDITEDRPGLPLDLELVFTDVHNKCSPIKGARVDLWQCDKDGIYSGVRNLELVKGARHDDTRGQTWLRGVQMTDALGRVRFHTIYPGWYPSRITHIHYQIFLPGNRVVTSQIAFPEDVTHRVYETPFYKPHGQNTVVTSLKADNVFGDDEGKYQMIKLVGDERKGFKGLVTASVAMS